jgi:hypothetical protein
MDEDPKSLGLVGKWRDDGVGIGRCFDRSMRFSETILNPQTPAHDWRSQHHASRLIKQPISKRTTIRKT